LPERGSANQNGRFSKKECFFFGILPANKQKSFNQIVKSIAGLGTVGLVESSIRL
jgi:hypothetical protein